LTRFSKAASTPTDVPECFRFHKVRIQCWRGPMTAVDDRSGRRKAIVIGLVVGIAADGVDAIPAVFDQFPRDFDAAVIVVLDPSIPDVTRVLSLVRRSAHMRVVHAIRSLPLETGSIFALPTPRSTRLRRLKLRIGPSVSNWMDELFTSIGSELRWRAVGVILGKRFAASDALQAIEQTGGRVVSAAAETSVTSCPHRELGRRVVAIVERLRNRERACLLGAQPMSS
jgi:chemotaxis response regulator CheB